MHLIIVPRGDADYFDANYPVSKLEKDIDGVGFEVNNMPFPGAIRAMEEAPSKVFQEDEVIKLINLTESLSATIVARTLLRDDCPDVEAVLPENSPLQQEESKWLLDEIMDNLDTVARFSGRNVRLIVDGFNIVPPTGTEETVTIVMGSPAPGFWHTRSAGTLFGHPICKRDYSVTLATPSLDMGTVVKNDLDESVAQIAGHTIYLFLPVNRSSYQALSDGGGQVFTKTLGLAWEKYKFDNVAAFEVDEITSSETLAESVPSVVEQKEKITAEMIAADEEIAAAQRWLRKAISDKRALVVLRDGLQHQPEVDFEEAWERLNLSPFFDKAVKASDGKTHYQTKPLVLQDDTGQDRFLGAYCIRFQGSKKVVVWSLNHAHYGGVPHPHINRQGSVCLGNVSESVMQLLVDGLEVDAALLVMQLLAEGYDPTLTENRLEEWPTVVEYERRKKT